MNQAAPVEAARPQLLVASNARLALVAAAIVERRRQLWRSAPWAWWTTLLALPLAWLPRIETQSTAMPVPSPFVFRPAFFSRLERSTSATADSNLTIPVFESPIRVNLQTIARYHDESAIEWPKLGLCSRGGSANNSFAKPFVSFDGVSCTESKAALARHRSIVFQ
jgi:hypothetical protein